MAAEVAAIHARPRATISSLAAPATLLYGFFALIPLVLVVVLAFTDYSSRSSGGLHFVGSANWVRLVHDSLVQQSILQTIIVIVLCWAVQTGLGMIIGVFLAGPQRYRAVLSVLYFLPILLSPVAVAITWENLFTPYFGGLALTAHAIGLNLNIGWLATPGQSLFVVIAVICWQYLPFQSMLFLAGARQIPSDLYDAGLIDGAGRFRSFRYITLPQLRYTLTTSSILVLVGSLLYFELFLVMTNGGPAGSSTVLSLAMYLRGFSAAEEGYGSAIATILVILGLILSLIIVRVSGFAKMRSQQEGL